MPPVPVPRCVRRAPVVRVATAADRTAMQHQPRDVRLRHVLLREARHWTRRDLAGPSGALTTLGHELLPQPQLRLQRALRVLRLRPDERSRAARRLADQQAAHARRDPRLGGRRSPARRRPGVARVASRRCTATCSRSSPSSQRAAPTSSCSRTGPARQLRLHVAVLASGVSGFEVALFGATAVSHDAITKRAASLIRRLPLSTPCCASAARGCDRRPPARGRTVLRRAAGHCGRGARPVARHRRVQYQPADLLAEGDRERRARLVGRGGAGDQRSGAAGARTATA